MRNYLDLLRKIMDQGVVREGRNGNTKSLFAEQLRFDLEAGFPLVTTKHMNFKSIVSELLWFVRGSSDVSELAKLNGTERTIWHDNVEAWKSHYKMDENDAGQIYGVQWRQWESPGDDYVDQLQNLLDKLRTNPTDRRLVVSAWNPAEIDQMCLPPCHMLFQCYVADGRLSLAMTQRSCDMFLGVPYNIASYALLTHMLATMANLQVGELIVTLNDVHIYDTHYDAVREQIERTPMMPPQLATLPKRDTFEEWQMDDFVIRNYVSHPAIKAKMVV